MTVELDKAEKKRLKKEKKERKLQQAAQAEEDASTILADEGTPNTFLLRLCDLTITGAVHKEKKRKHKDLEAEEQDSNPEGEKSKKRKKSKGPVPEELSDEQLEKQAKKERKEKKKAEKEKRKTEAAAAASSAPADGPSSNGLGVQPAPTASSSDVSAFLKRNNISLSAPITPILTFDALSSTCTPPKLQQILKGKFKEPTPIQACTWPAALDGKDVVGIAETGSGKTFAFGVPALSRIISSSSASQPGISVLVVAPTRELALQTHDNLSSFAAEFGIASIAVFGGVSRDEQIKALSAAISGGNKGKKKGGGRGEVTTKIVVGTPGRIIDLINAGALDLSGYCLFTCYQGFSTQLYSSL
jgi:ATP-dependent RNA helicase DBP3